MKVPLLCMTLFGCINMYAMDKIGVPTNKAHESTELDAEEQSALKHFEQQISKLSEQLDTTTQQATNSSDEKSYYEKGAAYFTLMQNIKKVLHDNHEDALLMTIRFTSKKNDFTTLITDALDLYLRAHCARIDTYKEGIRHFPTIKRTAVPDTLITPQVEKSFQDYVTMYLGNESLQVAPWFSTMRSYSAQFN